MKIVVMKVLNFKQKNKSFFFAFNKIEIEYNFFRKIILNNFSGLIFQNNFQNNLSSAERLSKKGFTADFINAKVFHEPVFLRPKQ